MKSPFRKAVALIFFIVIFFLPRIHAQWVTIPDPQFVNYLQQIYPSCMNGNLMDTTCSYIVNSTSVNCSSYGIQNLEGIEYFDGITFLDCQSNQLTSLPTLPPSLIYFYCKNNLLTSLPSLPSPLVSLECSNNQLTSLPLLPGNLTYLNCGNNQLTNLPTLPSSLVSLSCEYNMLSSLPSLPSGFSYLVCYNNQLISLPTFPSSITEVDCSINQLASLPVLPIGLTRLNCRYNQLSNLGTLPTTLTYLYCGYNQLTALPSLPSGLILLHCNNNQISLLPVLPNSLESLYCYSNLLTFIPSLPPDLNWLYCSYNQLPYLPDLPPSLIYLNCSYNQLTCIPVLPNTLITTNCVVLDGNPISCLPNYVTGMSAALLAMPLCIDNDLTNNPNACAGFKGVYGYTYKDVNSNCSLDPTDEYTDNIPVKLLDSSGTLINTFYSLSNGIYNYILDTGVYIITIDTVNKPFTANCINPGVDSTVTLTSATLLAKDVNFDIACKPGFDLGIKSINTVGRIFPAELHQLNIAAGDLNKWYNLNCTGGISGNVIVTVNGPVMFGGIAGSALVPSNINGNIFTYTIADFGALNLNDFALWFNTNANALSGDQICVTVNVTPIIGDNDTTNNNYTYCYAVTNSYDPNDKQVYPTTVNPSYNGYFTYTINFQNVGTAAAQNIRVVDTLASNLDLSTFEIINYSHANTSTLTGNVATFRFPNIQLADSASNPEGSKGYIQYRIKPIANLPFGTQIENKADIYFDFNAPITTNTAVSTFNSTVGVSNVANKTYLNVYPNPGKGIYNLRFSDNSISTRTIEVFNLIGEKVFSGITKTDNAVIDLANEFNGVYVLRVSDTSNVYTQRIVKQ